MPIQIDDSGNRFWKPSRKQEEFIRIPDSIFEGLFGGAAGGGKSELLLNIPILRNWLAHPRFKGIVFRRSFPQLEESLIPRSAEYYKPLGGNYNGSKHVWDFPSGATIRFSYLDRDENARDHDTAEYNYLAFDELTGFTEFMYIYLLSRVRTSSKDLPAIVRSASNPGNIGHSWVKSRFVDPHRYGNKIISDQITKSKRIFIFAKATDNPYLMDADPGYVDRLRNLPEAEQKAKIEGDWDVFSGQVFTEFRPRRFPNEPDNALHVIDPFSIPAYWPRILSIDWGYTASTIAHWSAVSPDGRVFVYREYAAKKTSIKQWGADIARLSELDDNIVARILDPSAWKEEGHEKSIAQQLIDICGYDFERADNARIAGKQNFHDFLRFQPRASRYVPHTGYSEEDAQYILRNQGLKAYHEYRELFEPEKPEMNLPRLQIFNNCPELIKVIPLCIYDERRKEDVAAFDGDDAYDCIRYNLMAVDRYVKDCDKTFQKQVELARIIENAKTGEQTDFYRQMEAFESKYRTTGKHTRLKRKTFTQFGIRTH